MSLQLVDISTVTIPPNRQRSEGKSSKDLEGLKKSILSTGLLHAPILTDDKVLVVGERRLLAIRELYEDSLQIKYEGSLVPLGMLPYTRFIEADKLALEEAEFDENIWRLNLTWQEETQATVRLHELRLARNPQQTLKDTATEIMEKQGKPPEVIADPAQNHKEVVRLMKLKRVAENLHLPAVASAPNANKAYVMILDQTRRQLERDLIALNPKATPHELILGDFRSVSSTLPEGTFDLLLTDPPYGINAHTAGSGALAHQYDDTPAYALDLYRHILRSSFLLLKPMGTLFMFCDLEHFMAIRLMAEQQTFSTFRTPLIWRKGTEGHAPWGRDGPKRTYEVLLYAAKGQRSLALPFGPDIIDIPRSTVDPERVHAAEKPVELLRFLVQKACRAGDKVLDPCCGSGPIFTAVEGLGIHVTGVELSPDYHTLAASRLARLAEGSEVVPGSLSPPAHPETTQDFLAGLLKMK